MLATEAHSHRDRVPNFQTRSKAIDDEDWSAKTGISVIYEGEQTLVE